MSAPTTAATTTAMPVKLRQHLRMGRRPARRRR